MMMKVAELQWMAAVGTQYYCLRTAALLQTSLQVIL